MKTYYTPEENLMLLGLTKDDLESIKKALGCLHEKNKIELVSLPVKQFDLAHLVIDLLTDEDFRLLFLDIYDKRVTANALMEANGKITLSLKWNVFLESLMELEQGSILLTTRNCIEQIKTAKLYYVTLIDAFFEMLVENNYTKPSIEYAYDLLSKSATLERTGWKLSKLPTPHLESTAEHMFNMYHMAMLYLPNKLEDVSYQKERVLKMVMLHDLGENLTGDIPHPKKNAQDEIIEDLKAQSIFAALMYEGFESGKEYYELWLEWTLNNTLTAMLAHDLDVIQLNYQFLTYCKNYPNTFTEYDITRWTRRRPKTELGKKIYDEVIFHNPLFSSLIKFIEKGE